MSSRLQYIWPIFDLWILSIEVSIIYDQVISIQSTRIIAYHIWEMRVFINSKSLDTWVYILIWLKLCLIALIVTKRRHSIPLLACSPFHWILTVFMRHWCCWILWFHFINTPTLWYLWEMSIPSLSPWDCTLNLRCWFSAN